MKKNRFKSLICGLSVAVLSLTPLTAVCAETENAKFSINCPTEVVVDNGFSASVTCNSAEEFASLSFKLSFDPSVLQLKKNEDGEVSWKVNTDSGDPTNDSIDVTDAEDGIIYLMMPDEVTYHYLSLDLDFTAIKEGESTFAVDVTEINKDGETQISHDANPVATANISVKAENTEPPTTTTETTTTTTSESTTTTTTTSTTITTSSTTNSTTSSNKETTTTTTTTTTSNTNSNNANTNNNTTSSSTTKPSTTTSKQTTTNKTTTTTKSNSSSNKSGESPNTGDNFPFLPLLVTLGASASVAFVTKKSKSE